MADTAIFLQCLREILPALKSQTDERIIKRVGKEKFENAVDDVHGLIESGVSSTLTRNEHYALTMQVMLCLTRYIKDVMGMPVTINTVFDTISLVEHALDQSFPGYASARLLRYIILPQSKMAV